MEGGAILRILIRLLLHTMCVVQPVVEAQKQTEEYRETEQQTGHWTRVQAKQTQVQPMVS